MTATSRGDIAQQQHYVPQFHLRQWAEPGDAQIRVLDKAIPRVFVTSSRNVGGEKFYLGDSPGAQAIEEAFARLESGIAKTYSKIKERKSLAALSESELDDLHLYVASMIVKPKETRESSKQLAEELASWIAAATGMTDWTMRMTEEGAADFHLDSFANIPKYASLLRNLGESLLLNDTGISFTTSDNPVTRHNSLPSRPQGGGRLGLACQGILLHMPISPKLCLVLYDKRTYAVPTIVVPSDIRDVLLVRELQLRQCYRHVFCGENEDFATEMRLLGLDQSIGKPDRRRFVTG